MLSNLKKILYIVLTVLSFVYSIFIYMLNSGTFSFVIWIIIAIGFLILYLLSINDNYKIIPRVIRYVLYVLASIGFIIFIIIESLILSKFSSKPINNLDYIIVLGAQVTEYGPNIAYQYRLDAAYDYIKENDNTICILTGGKGKNEPISEGLSGYNYLIDRGINKNRLLYEETSTSTYGNIKNASILINDVEDIEDKTIGIVTNKYHLFRASKVANKILNKDTFCIPANINKFYLLNSLVREFFGVIKDIWKIL